MHSRIWLILGVALVMALLFPGDALAYLDPGSGSMIFQTVVAALAGIAYGVRVYWSRIAGWFGRRSSPAPDAGVDSDPPSLR